MNTTYPEIYNSTEINEILNKAPQLPIKPQEPQRPTPPIDPGDYHPDYIGNIGFSIFGMIGAIALFCFSISLEFEKNTVIMVLASIGLFILSFLGLKMEAWEKNSHEEKQRKYKADMGNYPEKVRAYEKESKKYKEELISYEKKVEDIISPISLEEFRSSEIRNYLRNRRIPAIMDLDLVDAIKIGASERFFQEKLELQGFNLIEGKKIQAGGSFFYPDVLIEDRGIYVDVEIDEPYAGNDGTPIHYIKQEYGFPSSIDEKRNDFFVKNGFEVIRFSEEQIFRNPDNCIQLISDFIESILCGRKYVFPENNSLKTNKWTYEESMKMAYRRFRRTYVPKEYAAYIDKEEQHSYQEILNELRTNIPINHLTESAAQALYDKGVASVVSYSLGKHEADSFCKSFSIDEFKAKMNADAIVVIRNPKNGNLFFRWGPGKVGAIATTALTEDGNGCIAKEKLEIVEMYSEKYVTESNPLGIHYLLKARNVWNSRDNCGG